MNIKPSTEALATQFHPLMQKHPETCEEGIFGCVGYEGYDRLLHRTTIAAGG